MDTRSDRHRHGPFETREASGVDVHRSPVRLPRLALLGMAVLLLAAACNRGGDKPGEGSAAVAADLPRVGDFEIVAYQTGSGLTAERMQFSAVLDAGKPVVLNFWAGLCPPCRAEMPEFQEVYDEYSDRILMLGIDLGPFTGLGNTDQGRALLSELGVSYPAGTTEDADVVARFQVLGMPTTLFVTPDGGVVAKWTGILTKEKLIEHVDELLAVSR
ncbi:MAG: thioredoxin domain-containing protein [Spirochaetaceae bacterium]|nr:thioredoxin domain-containing protein [Spirochaetaceae bacterium]